MSPPSKLPRRNRSHRWCVSRLFYNIANRSDDALIDSLAEEGIGYVPFFPLGGFAPLQSETLSNIAARLNARPMSVALAWLLSTFAEHSAHSRNIHQWNT